MLYLSSDSWRARDLFSLTFEAVKGFPPPVLLLSFPDFFSGTEGVSHSSNSLKRQKMKRVSLQRPLWAAGHPAGLGAGVLSHQGRRWGRGHWAVQDTTSRPEQPTWACKWPKASITPKHLVKEKWDHGGKGWRETGTEGGKENTEQNRGTTGRKERSKRRKEAPQHHTRRNSMAKGHVLQELSRTGHSVETEGGLGAAGGGGGWG